MGMKKKRTAGIIIYHILVCVGGLIMVYPLIWMLMSSFKETNTIFATAKELLPEKATLDNYVNGWRGFAGSTFGRFSLTQPLFPFFQPWVQLHRLQ